eukprot:gb/GECH01000548.1/.p1 GENE.gb/GECH01000548.1/~~gb/GECH01000548.1/.p1  ORF type:complete len:434 (+),score=138.81 gb/GECH01000548.1/:1-1302(+)
MVLNQLQNKFKRIIQKIVNFEVINSDSDILNTALNENDVPIQSGDNHYRHFLDQFSSIQKIDQNNQNIEPNNNKNEQDTGVYSVNFDESIQSIYSQYTQGAVSSCTFASILGSFFILSRYKLNEDLIIRILEISSQFHSGEEHIEVQNALYDTPELQEICECDEPVQREAHQLTWSEMCTHMKNSNEYSAVVITKAAESFCLCYRSDNHHLPWVIFDSHSRRFRGSRNKSHGAGFYFFHSQEQVVNHLAEVFPYIPGLEADLMTQAINICDMVSIRLKNDNPSSALPKNNWNHQVESSIPPSSVSSSKSIFNSHYNRVESYPNDSRPKEFSSTDEENWEIWRSEIPQVEKYFRVEQKIEPLTQELKNQEEITQKLENYYELLKKKNELNSKLLENIAQNENLEEDFTQNQHQKLDRIGNQLKTMQSHLNRLQK